MTEEQTHVNVNSDAMECTHCGFRQAVKMPISAADMLTAMDLFLAHHKDCEAPRPETAKDAYIVGFDAGFDYVLHQIERWIVERSFDPRAVWPVEELLRHLRGAATKVREST
jgi:hypothetical protein